MTDDDPRTPAHSENDGDEALAERGATPPEPVMSSNARSAVLRDVLTESRRLGFLGPGPIDDHVLHAMGFVPLVSGVSNILDLGSGGGLPGLVLMTALPTADFVLLDASTRRCDFLRWAVEQLGLVERASVVCGRAEELAHDPELRGRFPVVVSRSFGAPAVTAECAVGFLDGPGARLLVSEPPDAVAGRWPADGLEGLGLRPGDQLRTEQSTIQVLELVTTPPLTVPRRVGVPSKRPRFVTPS